MTKEELEKEAKEYVTSPNNNDYTIEAYIAGAEPREKRIAELEKENAELKAQVEKMKSDYEYLLDEKIELENRLTESRECY